MVVVKSEVLVEIDPDNTDDFLSFSKSIFFIFVGLLEADMILFITMSFVLIFITTPTLISSPNNLLF